MLTTVPFGAADEDLAEFMLGRVAVNVVFFESIGGNPNFDVSTEDWTPTLIQETKTKISEGLQWWVDTLDAQNSVHSLEFDIDWTHADSPINITQEPINRSGDEFLNWGSVFFHHVGFQNASAITFDNNLHAYNHQQRVAREANWAFTIFVANSENDPDDSWNGGAHPRAFADAQGKLIVMPSGRPASTLTHETGHMFWALDEYTGSYLTTRGVYNTPNTNNSSNPNLDENTREDSIMDVSAGVAGSRLENAYAAHTSSQSSLEMIGWRDSDGDGIFDILDVPHTLEGSGYYDEDIGRYIFRGTATVGTIPNLNPRPNVSTPAGSQQNDVTINQITHVEYRVDGGQWQQLPDTYNTYEALLDLSIPVASGFTQIELRAVDSTTRRLIDGTNEPDTSTGVVSNTFVGSPLQPTATATSGITGFVRHDADGSGTLSASETTGLVGWTVRLIDQAGTPISLVDGVEPDDFPNDFTQLNTVNSNVTLTAIGSGTNNSIVNSRNRSNASTGDRVFSHFTSPSSVSTEWTQDNRRLRVDFTSPITTLSVDAIANSDDDHGRLEIYDSNDNLIGRYTTSELQTDDVETMTLSRTEGDIAYAIASGHMQSTIRLDNLRFGAATETVTDAYGAYSLPFLPSGDYRVETVVKNDFEITTASILPVTLGTPASNIDFGVESTSQEQWQNPIRQFDVDNNTKVELLDAVILVNDINRNGERQLPVGSSELPPPYLDPSGDGDLTFLDVIAVINEINRTQPSAEGEAGSDDPERSSRSLGGSGVARTPMTEGEFVAIDVESQQVSSQPDIIWGAWNPSGHSDLQATTDSNSGSEAENHDDFHDLDSLIDDIAVPLSRFWHGMRI